jgi:flagellar biosynthesis GTPase FlhF
MKIKSFYAGSIEAALQLARREFGDEALVLNTRETPAEFRSFGSFEVVCAVAAEPEPEPAILRQDQPSDSGPVIVWFVGPSGQGKSASCMKAALQSRSRHGWQVGLVSWDSLRIEGDSCIRNYCEIAGLPWERVESRNDFQAALDRSSALDVLFVDTPALEGRQELRQDLLAARNWLVNGEVHLVLSATSSADYLAQVWSRYREFRPTNLLPTHMDEAQFCQPASLVAEMQSLAVRWFGAGPSIPEDLQEVENIAPLRFEAARVPERDSPAVTGVPHREEQAFARGSSSLAEKLSGLSWQKLLRLPPNGKQNAA